MFEEINVILAKARLQRAREDYFAARLLLDKVFCGAANDRAYFCMYHAANAVCALDDRDLRGSCSVMSVFNHCYVDEACFDSRLFLMIEAAQKSRDDNNYNDCHVETRERTRRNLENAKVFLEAAESYIDRRVKLEYTPHISYDPDDED